VSNCHHFHHSLPTGSLVLKLDKYVNFWPLDVEMIDINHHLVVRAHKLKKVVEDRNAKANRMIDVGFMECLVCFCTLGEGVESTWYPRPIVLHQVNSCHRFP